MATINLGYRLFADSEEDALEKGVPRLQALWDKIKKALELVEQDCTNKFPDLVFEVDEFESQYIGADDLGELEGKLVWDLSYLIKVKTTSPDGIPECDFEINEYDRWRKAGEPMYKDVYEPLYDCDWSSVKPFCDADDTIGDIVSVEFGAVKAVDSYHGGIHLCNNQDWL